MTYRAHAHSQAIARGSAAGRRVVAAVIVAALMCAAALTGCAQSSNTTSTATSAPGVAPPTAGTPTTATTSTTTTTTGVGTIGAPGATSGLTVSPAVGSPHSVVHFAVTPSYRTGVPGGEDISNALSVMGPQKAGCVGVHEQGLAALPPGRETTVSLGPAQLGGDWCPGTYTARVEVVERPKCAQGMMCPQFIRVLAVLGPTTFRIAG
jgi:hypothetical protein